MSGKHGSFEKRKPRNEKQDEKKGGGDEVLAKNSKTAQKLAEATQKKPTEKKESNWKVGLGHTKAIDPENPLNSISSTGVKLTNKKSNFEATAGVGNIQEQKVPGNMPDNNPGFAIAVNWKF